MEHDINALGQPVGISLFDWQPPPRPSHHVLTGHFCRLEPIDAERHATDLHEANALDTSTRMWTYLSYGPFASFADYRAWLAHIARGQDPLFFAIVDQHTDKAAGVASYLRIEPTAGSIEIGHLCFTPLLQRKPAATEALFLMIDHVFKLGYRRCEWKCDTLNAPSRAAAQRLGFSFEGLFRQAVVVKGRNRDTAWFAIIDRDWPALREVLQCWLEPGNFDATGQQKHALSESTRPLLKNLGTKE